MKAGFVVGMLALGLASPWLADAAGMGTGFGYQGQLVQNGTPVNGNVTLRFSLWNDSDAGSMLGIYQIAVDLPVANGLFSVELNPAGQFGPTAFTGDARWLQIEICTDPSCFAPPTVLTPRQKILNAPYALHAAGPWRLSGTALAYLDGNVGIGTPSPQSILELKSGFNTDVLRFGYSPSDYHTISTGFHGGQAPLNYLGFNVERGSNDTRRVLTMQGDGNVGIGTATPTQRLQVVGNVYLGSNGQYPAAAGEENLRIVRGTINQNGTPINGCCYTVSHPLPGSYDITFNTPFVDLPTVVATATDLDATVNYVWISTATVRINIRHSAVGYNDDFTFIAMGQR